MGNLFAKKKQYKQLTFTPYDYIDENNKIIESSLEYHEYDDIQGLQEQIDNIKKHYNTIFNIKISNMEENVKEIKYAHNDIKTNIINLKELTNIQSRDLESLLQNDNILLSRINIIEEKVKYDEFINSESDEFKSMN
jgi:hypothetical protein